MLRTFKTCLHVLSLIPTLAYSADWTVGTTTIGSQPDATRLALFSNYSGGPVSSMPKFGEEFLDYTGGIFNPTFGSTSYYTNNGYSVLLSPNYLTAPIGRTNAHTPIPVGLNSTFSWRARHGQPIKDNFVTSSLNAYYNRQEDASWWMANGLSFYQQSNYFKDFGTFPSELSILQHLIDKGPMLAEIVPFHIPVLIVGYSLDAYGNWVLEFTPFWGADWGDQGFGKMLFDDFANFSIPDYDMLANQFEVISPEALCEDRDNDLMCSWGLGDRPFSCPAECDMATVQDCSDSVASELFMGACFRNGEIIASNDLEIIDFSRTETGNLSITYRNNGPGTFRNYPRILVEGFNMNSFGVDAPASVVGQVYTKVLPGQIFQWGEGQNYNVSVTIDSFDNYQEGNESNNQLSKVISIPIPPKPDLIVESIALNVDSIKVTVLNQGQADCPSGRTHQLDLYYGPWPSYLDLSVACPAPGARTEHNYSLSQMGISSARDVVFSAYADYYNHISESDESNNTLITTMHFDSAVAVDIAIDSVTYDSSSDAIKVQVRNAGLLRTTEYVGVKVTIGASISSYYIPSQFLPGQTQVLSFPLSSLGYAVGSQNVSVLADFNNVYQAEVTEINNSWAGDIDLPIPDLAIESIIASGDNIVVKVVNLGSKNNFRTVRIDTTTNSITKSYNLLDLAAGASHSITYTKADFNVAVSGDYVFNSNVDVLNNAVEANEGNNSLSATVALTAPAVYADLVVEDIYVSGSYIYARIKNNGNGPATSPVTEFANGVSRGYYYHSNVPSLSTSTASYYRYNLYLSDGSTYEVKVCTQTSTVEPNTANNCLTKSLTMPLPPKPDLTVLDIVDNGTSLAATIKNVGNATAYYFYTKLATGSSYSTAYTSSLYAGSSVTLNFSKSSFALGAGTYNFTATADYNSYISESNESNNALTKALTFNAPSTSVDLVVQSIIQSGSNILVSVKNNGTSSATGFYTQLMGNGISRTAYVGSLMAGSSTTLTFYSSDFYVGSGTYNFSSYADYYSYVTESNESNNSLSASLTFGTSSAVDLIIQNITLSGSNIQVVVKNNGSYVSGGFYTQLSGNGSSRTVYLTSLSAGASSTLTFYSTDFYVSSGTYTFSANADVYGYVTESIESNNGLSASLAFGSSSSVDLVVQSMTLSGSNILVSVKNNGTSAAGGFYTRLTGNGISKIVYLSSLAAGSSSSLSFYKSDFSVGSSSYTFTANADYYSYVTESNEINNALSESLNFGTSSSGATGGNELQVVSLYSDPTTIYVQIYNAGFQTITTDFYIKYQETGLSGYTSVLNINDIAPFSYVTKTIYRTNVISGTRSSGSVTVTLDSDNRVLELNETDNVMTQYLSF